jgi:RNA polymerase sigma-70 factor (ECF subfamily)
MSTLTLTGAVPGAAAAALEDDALAAHALRVATRTAMGVLADRDAAADVAQEVALVALRKRSSLRDPGKLDAWLHRTAARAALREAGRGRNRALAERAAARPERTHDEHAGSLAAAQMLAPLPPRQRAALTLRYVHDLDDRAIAAALGCRRGTVRSLLSRGLAALREQAADAPPGLS